jgi:hypothetical protein
MIGWFVAGVAALFFVGIGYVAERMWDDWDEEMSE